MSKLRRSWGSIFVLMVVPSVALVAACGPPDAAGSRTGQGSGGTGGSGGSDGSPGTPADGAPAADGLGPFDGGACIDDGSNQTAPNMAAASGTFSGALAGAVCTGGAFAQVRSVPADDGGAPTVTLLIDSAVAAAAAGSVRFQSPSNATGGLINIEIGLPSASPGTYDAQSASCGDVVLAVNLPAPDPSICAVDASSDSVLECPDGCQQTGLSTCGPIAPQASYAALGASDCVGDVTTPVGSWTLTLTALTPDPAGPDSSGNLAYAPHGTLTGTLADQAADGGTANVTLTLSF